MSQRFDVHCGCGALAVLVLCACGGGGGSTAASVAPAAPTLPSVPPGPLAGPREPAQKEASSKEREPVVAGRPDAPDEPVAIAVQLAAASAPSQRGREGEPVRELPAVVAKDSAGQPVAGALVRFEVVVGAGSVAGAEVLSGDDGRAQVGGWTLGTGAQQALRATVAGSAAALTFEATASSPAERYDVTLRYVAPLTDRQRATFEAARRRIEEVVTGDLPDATLRLTTAESCAGVALDERVDDLLVAVRVVEIDGAGGTLGRAGPCLVRGGSNLPALALMEFDSADLDSMDARGQLESVILHEMLHTVGFGTVWGTKLVNAGSEDPFFDGAEARAAFHDHDRGASYSGVPVPVENTGNPGTRDAHWREQQFGDELMTGTLTGFRQPLSRTTIASLQDLGYAVDLSAGEDTQTTLPFGTMGAPPEPLHLGDDALPMPIRVLH